MAVATACSRRACAACERQFAGMIDSPMLSSDGAMVNRLSLKVLSRVHILLYRGSGGLIGNRLAGMPILMLTTTGRKTGKRRTVPLGYLPDGPNYVLIGSNAGQDRDPDWILNLRSKPQASIQIRRAHTPVVAEQANSAERSRLWANLIARAPVYDTYRRKTPREIPMMVLRPQF